MESIDADELSSVDDFIRELEEKEKDLHISSDLVIEVGESSVEYDNIIDSFIGSDSEEEAAPTKELEPKMPAGKTEKGPPDDKEVAKLKKQIDELISERDELVSSVRRQKIDFENFRGRAERDRKDTFRNILSNLALQILPVIDNLDRALENITQHEKFEENEVQRFIEGIVLVSQQMNEVLNEMGVRPISSLGESFDPEVHEAVDCVPVKDAPPNTVIEELLRGYSIDERVIRPAMVRVSSPDRETE